jgi:hypothetical protein
LREWHKSSLIRSLLPYNKKVIKTSTQMGTRSRIGIQLADESILSVYCHWDGYPEFNGVKLVENFNTREKVEALVDGGDISALWTNLGWNNETLPETGPLYYSSRGEDCPPRLDANKYDYLAEGEEYAYIYTLNDEWVCYNRYQFEDNRMPEVVEIPAPVAA